MSKKYNHSKKGITKRIIRMKMQLCYVIMLFAAILSAPRIYAQCNSDAPVPFTNSNFDDLSVTSVSSGVCTSLLGCSIDNANRLIDPSTTNYATADFGAVSVLATHTLTITDGNTVYAAGTYAGFKIQSSNLVSLLGGIKIKLYNGNTLTNTFETAGLLSLLDGGNYILGGNATMPFNKISIELSTALTSGATNIFHAVIREYCAGPTLDCNESTVMSLPNFPVIIDAANTGISGISVGSVSNANNAVSASTSDFASINLTVGLLATGNIAIKDQITDYPAGTFAGFEIENTNLLSIGALGNVVVATYLNGIYQEQFSGSNLLVGTSLLNATGRNKIGFITTKDFDEVKFTINQALNVSLGTTRIYSAIFQKFCVGPDLSCNVKTAMTSPEYPVFVNSVNSGINGVACLLCDISGQDNLVDADPTNFASVNLAVGVGTSASLSVKDQITDYPAGTFAGYAIENPSLLNVNALDAVTVNTYLNGILQDSESGGGALISVGTGLLVGTSKQTIGFVTSKDFDEVQIVFQNLASVNLGTVNVYNAIFQKLCAPVVACNTSYELSNPDFPVVINRSNSGIDGLACVACAVNDTDNLLTSSNTDFATITLTAAVSSSGSVSVKDQLFTYPKGTFAGFKIFDNNTLLQLNLFQSLTISLYNDGVFQESKSGNSLIDLGLLGGVILGSGPGGYNVGFIADSPFDEIRLSVNSLASVINTINVYGAFVNTANSNDGGTGNLQCNSSITLTKEGVYTDENGDGITNAGDKINYTFGINNTGAVDLTNVTLTDDNATVVGTPIGVLAAGTSNTTSYSANYTITQADVDAGVVYNLATVNAATPFGGVITATSTDPTPCVTCPINPVCPTCTATPLSQDPAIAFVKTAVYNGDPTKAKVGDIITYTFTVTNTGNVSVNNIVINDAKLGATNVALAPSVLAPTEVGVATRSYTITQADLNLGHVTNTAIATGQDGDGNTVEDISGTAVDNDDSTITTIPTDGKLAFVKTAVYNGDPTKAKVGDIITYTFTVTNTGNVSVNNIVINDAKLGATNVALAPSTLAPTEVGVATRSYTITQADLNLGHVTNTAIATGQDGDGNTVEDISGTAVDNDDSTITTIPTDGKLAFVKTAVYNGDPTKAKVGDVITYTFTVTNTGNVSVNNIVINDAKLGATNVALAPSTLAPTEVGVATRSYTITQADLNLGQVTNTAIATGQDGDGNTVEDISGTAVDNDDSTITTIPTDGKLAFVKTAVYNGDPTKAKVGDVITYTFTVTNTGNVSVNNIVINDAKLGATNVALAPSTLAPTEVGVATRSYTITQADLNLGHVTNTAIATGQDGDGNTVEDISGTAVDNDDSTVTTIPTDGKLDFVKTAVYNGDPTKAKVGDVITYTFTVTNTGNVSVNNIVINDAKLGATNVALAPSVLAPTEVGVATRSYTITQADLNLGQVTNTAIATGQDGDGNTVEDISGTAVDNDDSTITTIPTDGKLAFVKTAVYNGDSTKAKVGDVITYTFTVTNTGNVSVNNIVINDAKLGATNVALTPSVLAPTEVGVATRSYTITQADLNLGHVTNTAIATGQDGDGNTVEDISGTAVDNDDSTVTTIPTDGKLAFVKTAVYNGDPTKAKVGDVITYTFTVTNTGNVSVNNIVINDAKLGATNVALTPSVLAPTEVGVATRSYTITQADLNLGHVTNTAIATGQDGDGNTVEDISGTAVDNDDSTITTIPIDNRIALVKTAELVSPISIGSNVKYTFTVTNLGTGIISNIIISDPMVGLTLPISSILTLNPGETSSSIVGNYTITQSDINRGQIVNSAEATGKDSANNDVADISGTAIGNDTPTITQLAQSPSISITKDGVYQDTNGDGITNVGDNINYVFVIRNTGNTVLTNVTVEDNNAIVNGVAIPIMEVNAVNSTAYTATHGITQQDMDAGIVYNLATVTANTPVIGTPIITAQSTDPTICSTCPVNPSCALCTMTELTQSPKIALIMKATFADENGDGLAQIGESISYTYTVINTGNVSLSNVWVEDIMTGHNNSNGSINLAVGGSDSNTFKSSYVLTEADIRNGMVANQSKVFGTTSLNNIVSDLSDDDSALEDDRTIIELNGCKVEPMTAVSPNGDGDNEMFYIKGLECHPDNTLEIYNRWGVLVFERTNYNNSDRSFRGVSEGRLTVSQGSELPEGNYYYILNYKDNDSNMHQKAGYLYINR
ncbi:DUF7507 domain-containing protein [Flavobacterium algicola]|uniref:DUF7507 domain-containing protein n=1 Tax=Flavobacterium algicola TaxID=556529 RepID=UPI001EFE193A|nr:gliding motility-associated C-terminal domain-containing protein [Flavobacterium algicola]MCG9794061.1 gliding motility-associated C-terminal domain-containing protein [Flavobacterium algicola]